MILLRRLLPYVLMAAAIAAVLFAMYSHGVRTERARQEVVISGMVQDHMKAQADMVVHIHNKEREAAARVAVIDQQHQEEINNAKKQINRINADLHAGAIRLRDRFACPTSDTAAGATATATGVDHGGEKGGLRGEDADFLIRIASEADDVVNQLSACQALVNTYRQ